MFLFSLPHVDSGVSQALLQCGQIPLLVRKSTVIDVVSLQSGSQFTDSAAEPQLKSLLLELWLAGPNYTSLSWLFAEPKTMLSC